MGLVVSYDEKFGLPNSEIELTSGEHIFVALGRNGLEIKLLAAPGAAERVLFRADPETAARICDGLFDIQPGTKSTPLQMLVAAAVHLPDARAVEHAFRTAAAS
jgi:hypothetical protein